MTNFFTSHDRANDQAIATTASGMAALIDARPREGMGLGGGVTELLAAWRDQRKVNSSPLAERGYRRYQIAKTECERRGVRFLPSQVLRPLYERAGLL